MQETFGFPSCWKEDSLPDLNSLTAKNRHEDKSARMQMNIVADRSAEECEQAQAQAHRKLAINQCQFVGPACPPTNTIRYNSVYLTCSKQLSSVSEISECEQPLSTVQYKL